MAKQTSDAILSSLRSRILLAVAALVVFNSIFGLLGYLAVSFVISEPVYAVVTSVAAMTAATAGFGWWLSTEILRPIEALSLLARSLERSPSASLPKTTGASETDELLFSLHRNSQQVHNLIALMDDVAGGKTDAAMEPLQNPDRLSVAFQKLVAKVVESIKAKEQLDMLQSSVTRLRNDVSSVRSGDLSVEFHGDLWQVSEIAEAFKYVVSRFSELINHVSASSTRTKDAASEARSIVRSLAERESVQNDKLRRTASMLEAAPQRFTQLTDQLGTAVQELASGVAPDDGVPLDHMETITRLRSLISESRSRLEQLRERSGSIPLAARRTDEIARRSNIIALNTALHGRQSGSSPVLADEISSLSSKAELVHKDMLTINESLVSDLLNLDTSLNAIAGELPQVAAVAGRQHDALNGVGTAIDKLDAIHSALKSYLAERLVENEAVIGALTAQFDGKELPAGLKKAEHDLETILHSADALREAIADFRSAPAGPEPLTPSGHGQSTQISPPVELA